jgi:hypothetical protein
MAYPTSPFLRLRSRLDRPARFTINPEVDMPRICRLLLSFAVMAVPCAEAQSIEPPLADRIAVGTVVTVTDETGKSTMGRVQSVSNEELSLSRRGGVEAIPVSSLVRIEKPDRLINGALIGLTIGVTAGIISGAGLHVQGESQPAGYVVVSTVGNAVIWTALGTAVDAIFNNKRTLYERGGRRQASLAPIVGPGARGAAVRLTW